jgi:tetratricopeptide (TPR) repeat protein
MRPARITAFALPLLAVACSSNPDRQTLAKLHTVQPDVEDVAVADGLDKAMATYRRFLDETPQTAMTPDAMRRLADLKIEKEFGLLGDGEIVEMAAPDAQPSGSAPPRALTAQPQRPRAAADLPVPEAALASIGTRRERTAEQRDAATAPAESLESFEARASAELAIEPRNDAIDLALPGAATAAPAGPIEAIALYQQLLEQYPTYEHNDQVLYQMARAYDELGRTEEAMEVMADLIARFPHSRYVDEVHFRRAEYFFARHRYREAEGSYAAITTMGVASPYYELALYKLGWTLYKMEFYEEALDRYVALLDYKVSVGYDFDAAHDEDDEDDERRVADTFRVISLSFSNLGGTEVLAEYFGSNGHRSYEDRIYDHLGQFYLAKLRYHDAAEVYESFVELNPFHRVAPDFSMRVIGIYTDGGFPMLVVESKKAFATNYGLTAPYWRHFDVAEFPQVVVNLKRNLEDLANHYHALYQDESLADEQLANYDEARQWYRQYLVSFPTDPDSPPINYQLADLLLEHEDFGQAAVEYEHTAYDYAPHERAAAAGYAAIYAHREHFKVAVAGERAAVRRDTVTSSLRFADTFPDHEHADVVLGAAADDLYDMKDFQLAIDSARKLIERYPNADVEIRRSAWVVVAHSSFDLAQYPDAEFAYARVLELTGADDETRVALVDNLAASIYKQGEQANELGDYAAAADHFLRIRTAAPTSTVRAAAEYDAGAALMHLEDWTRAAKVFDDFRSTYPEHELQKEATTQIAHAYQHDGQLTRAASEYERMSLESEDPDVRSESLLLAGDLYEQEHALDRALVVYARYVEEFPQPVDLNVETRFKLAGMYDRRGNTTEYHEELEQIVAIDAAAGTDRTDRTRFLAAQSSLVLTRGLYEQFARIRLAQPFEQSLKEKQRRMDETLAAFNHLVDYQVGEVTAAATYYIAEIYSNFSTSLMQSERPTDLAASDLDDYEAAIEEEAFPFEERAIEVHEKNLELVAAGVYNDWIEKSLDRLAVLMPGRYAKNEISTGFLASIDTYMYRVPSAAAAAAEPAVESDPEISETTGS